MKEKIWKILQRDSSNTSFLLKIPVMSQTIISGQDQFKVILKKKQDFTKSVSLLISKINPNAEDRLLQNLRAHLLHQPNIEIDEQYQYPRSLPAFMSIKSVFLLNPERFRTALPDSSSNSHKYLN